MKLGAVYPQTETGSRESLEKIGAAVDTMGFDSLLMYDHVLGAQPGDRDPPLWGPYTERDPFHDPLAAFAFLAGFARRIEFITGVLVLPQRQTALVARQAADVDLFSGGRLTLGVGTGWNHVEYAALGEDFGRRGEKLDEQIPYLKRLWSEGLVSHQGTFDTAERIGLNPRPDRSIPILCGGFGEKPYRRAVSLADGFLFAGDLEAKVLPGWHRTQQLLEAHDRSRDSFAAYMILQTDAGQGLDVPQALNTLHRWRDAGGCHASICSMRRGYRTAEEHIDYLAEVLQRFDR